MPSGLQQAHLSYQTKSSPLQDFGVGAQEAILDIVANPWTVGTFALVTTVGSLLMGQDRFPRLKGATCWVMRDGMKGMYYVGLGVSGARTIYNLSKEDFHGAGHAMTLGVSIAVTKYVGDRWMQPFLMRAGEMMMRAAERAPVHIANWLRTQGRAMTDVAGDRMASSGLALCAHSFDEIASLVVMLKSLSGLLAFDATASQNLDAEKPLTEQTLSQLELGVVLLLGFLGGAAIMNASKLSVPSPAFGGGVLTTSRRCGLFNCATDGT